MSNTFRALSNPNYRMYFAGTAVSSVGTWMMRIAQDWLVLIPLGGGAHAVGIATALQFLPVLLLTPFAGVISDRFSKRSLLQVTQATMGLFALISAVTAITGHATLLIVYLCAFGLGVGSALDAPARQAFVSEMVSRDDLPNAVALNSAAFNSARLVGPAIAGLLIAWWGSGQTATGWVFGLNAVSYIAVIAQLRRMDVSALDTPKPRNLGRGALKAGLVYIGTQPKMIFVFILLFFVSSFGVNFQISGALMATDEFGKGAGEFGLIGSALAIGSLAASLMAARRTKIRMRLLWISALGFALAMAISGAMPTYWLFLLSSPLVGFAALTLVNSSNATIQLESEPAMRGRVMAIYMTVLQGGAPVGALLIGAVGAEYGARWSMWVGTIAAVVGLVVATTVYARVKFGSLTAFRRILTP